MLTVIIEHRKHDALKRVALYKNLIHFLTNFTHVYIQNRQMKISVDF